MIDQKRREIRELEDGAPVRFEEHESGPEILVAVALATAGITLSKSIIDLVATVVKARSEGRKKGDSRDEPLEIIVRRVQRADELREELIVRIGQDQKLDKRKLESRLKAAIEKIISDDESSRPE